MKKLYTLSLALLSVAAIGQTTRTALFEEFTGENCGPCASTNPGLDALVQANPTKIVMLKHQVPIPSAGPIYNSYKVDADNRRSYYSVNSAPNGRLDGASFGSNQTHPYYLSQADIDGRYNTPASFTLTASHTISSDLDSIYVTIVVTNAETSTVTSQSAGSLRLQVSVIEDEIHFATPPGTNGEKDFYHVNRYMIPGPTGTAMADSWTAGATQTYNFAVALPTHIYNYNEVGVVAYIQDNGDKSVMQAVHSASGSLVTNNPDLSISNLTQASGLCASDITPEFEITNEGQNTVTSADVRYRINGGSWTTQAWTGSLASGASATVTFPTATLPANNNVFEAEVINGNGFALDVNAMDNAIAPYVVNLVSANPQPAPFTIDFESTTAGSVPASTILNGSASYNTVINSAFVNGSGMMGAYALSDNSMLFGNYYLQAGTVSELILPKVDISASMYTNIYFSRASRTYAGENDKLEVMVSDDCGTTWTTLWNKSGAQLNTVPGNFNQSYFPSNASDWKMATIGIPQSMQNSTELIVKFVATSDYGNNLFIDNIWMSASPLSMEEATAADLKLFPNPAKDIAQVEFNASNDGDVELNIIDLNGRTVSTVNTTVTAGAQNISLDVSDLPSGVYMVQVRQNDNINTLRLNVAH